MRPILKFVLPVLFASLYFACSEEPATTNAESSPATSGHSRMVAILDSIAKFSNPMDNYALNSGRAAYWERERQNATDISQQASIQFKYAHELLKAGKTDQAIVEFTRLVDVLEQNGIGLSDQTKLIYEFQAVAYLRMGEEQNCLQKANPASCILPLGPEGQHELKKGSETAIQLLRPILEKYPEDPQLQWLFNFAHMTLGTYPQDVPAKWRIPASFLSENDSQLRKFWDVAAKMGVDVTGLSGSVVIEDFDLDGLLDIFATSYGLRDQCRLFLNRGDRFEEVTESAGLTGLYGGLNTLQADYNNDGWTDILVLRGAWFNKGGYIPNSLLKNNGDGTFTDVTIEAGLLSYHPTQTAAWADFNNDGWLDVFIGNETTEENGSILTHPCELYVNNGDGTFSNQAAAAGLNVTEWVKGVGVGDYNNDSWQDIYISIPGKPNLLFLNQGNLQFQEVAAQAGVQEPILSFPTWFFDYNNDGHLDLFVGSYDFRKTGSAGGEQLKEIRTGSGDPYGSPQLYLNNGDGTFSNQSKAAGLDKTAYAMGSNFGDLNADGYLDFYLGTGTPDLRAVIPNRMFLNQKGATFKEVTMSGFAHIQKGHGIAFGDLDNDGDEDIYCVMGGAYEGDLSQNVLFANPNEAKSWISLELVGVAANRSAIGAKIQIDYKDAAGQTKSVFRRLDSGGSFGASSLRQEIGLGDAVKIVKLVITWPGSSRAVNYGSVELNKFARVVQNQQGVEYLDLPKGQLLP